MTPDDHLPQPPADGQPPSAPGLSRRQLVRAGLSAAPVVAALKSNTVLAGGGGHTCIRPSTFSSWKAADMKFSHARDVRTDYECRSHSEWRGSSTGLPKVYNSKGQLINFKDQPFLSTACGFSACPVPLYSTLTLQQVLALGDNVSRAPLARHVVAAYLSAVAAGDHFDAVLLTRQQCNQIWNGGGAWQPFAGSPTWTYDQTLAYFNMVHGAAFAL